MNKKNEKLIKANAKTTNRFLKFTSAVARDIVNNSDAYDIDKAQERALKYSKDAKNYIFLRMKTQELLDSLGIITQYDKAILEAVSSLYEANNEFITERMIFKLLSGNSRDGRSKTTEQQREDIRNSLDKLRHTTLAIDYTEEAEANGYEVKSAIIDDYLLNVTILDIELNAQKVTAYKLNRKPLVLQYSQLSQQIKTIDSKVLNDKMRLTSENIAIRSYILERIEYARYCKQKNSSIILFDTLAEKCNLNIDARKEKYKKMNVIKKLLNHYKEIKHIKDYETDERATKFILFLDKE